MPVPTTGPSRPSAARQTGLMRLRSRLMPPEALPLVLLLMASSTVFVFGNDRGHFYRSSLHNGVTANHMSVAKNLSPKHDFLLFESLKLDREGAPAYRPYNRFPIGGYVLVRLAALPFADDFSAEIRAARTLMLVFFVLNAVLAYLALCRLVASRWAALAATLAAFSSFWLLYYNDMVATEIMPSLFGVLLAFHGMAVFVQEGRFRQLLVKACAALLLGWHVYALLLAFIVLGLAREIIGARPLIPRFGRSDRARGEEAVVPRARAPWARVGSGARGGGRAAGVRPRRYLVLGIVTGLFGAALLSFNLGNEYLALGGRVPLAELPTVRSAAERVGAADEFNARFAERLAWPPFLEEQFRRIGGMTFPYGLVEPIWASGVERSWEISSLRGMLAWGIVASGVCLVGLPFVRHRMLTATLVASGFCWALPMRHQTAFHDYDSVFYVGIPLTVFSLVFLCMQRLIGDRFVPVLAAAALPVFVLSGVKMAEVGHGGREAVVEGELMQDFEAIRGRVGEGVVRLPPQYWRDRGGITFGRMEYFLAGSVLLSPAHPRQELVDFVISHHRDEGPALLTPDNRRMFLYDRALYDASYDEQALGAPIIASRWNVHLEDGRLIYVGEECANTKLPFFLSMIPREAGAGGTKTAPPRRMEFRFDDVARRVGRRCVAAIDLPEQDLISVRTGQSGEEGPSWEGEYRFER